MAIKCQSCDVPLKSVFYEGNRVHLCFQCKGMFLGKDKLKNIEESREIDIPTETPAPARKQEIERLCPSCQASMKKVKKVRLELRLLMCVRNVPGYG
jgi:Zn-finger nucleic acid-binding protein